MRDSADVRLTPGENRDWGVAADELLDEAIDRDERITCRFDELSLRVPVRTGSDAPAADWQLDGTVEIAIEGERGPLVDWLQWWNDQA